MEATGCQHWLLPLLFVDLFVCTFHSCRCYKLLGKGWRCTCIQGYPHNQNGGNVRIMPITDRATARWVTISLIKGSVCCATIQNKVNSMLSDVESVRVTCRAGTWPIYPGRGLPVAKTSPSFWVVVGG